MAIERSETVVSSAYLDSDAGLVALHNHIASTSAEETLNNSEREVLSEIFVWHLKLDIINRVSCDIGEKHTSLWSHFFHKISFILFKYSL